MAGRGSGGQWQGRTSHVAEAEVEETAGETGDKTLTTQGGEDERSMTRWIRVAEELIAE